MYVEDKAKMIGPILYEKVFSFGKKDQLKSEGKYIITAEIHETKVRITMDVVSSDI